ncbi:YDG domain-containing protein, partial [Flavobacterium sp.]|uniref:YDG domain-containing protein n=1 Tax=Flavobacterium sp. TaxID=239 RepID=UPI003751DB75
MKQKLLNISTLQKLFLGFVIMLLSCKTIGQTTSVWSGTSGGAWLTGASWTPSGAPNSATTIASFGGSNVATTVGVNTNTQASLNVAAITFLTGSSTVNLALGNSASSGSGGTITFAGTTLNSVGNVVLRSTSSKNFTFQNNIGTGAKTLGFILGNTTDNIINIDGSGGVILSSIISGSSKKLTLGGSGSGALTLSGANTYTGATTINSATSKLILGASGVIADASNVILNGGTLNTGASVGFSETTGTLSLTNDATILLGTGNHALNFSDSNAVAWTSGKTLTITGWTGTAGTSGTAGKIFFGNSASGLTSTQISQISFTGFVGGAIILSSGEVVPVGALITPSSSPSSLTTTYGLASLESSFTVSGTSMSAGISINPPLGFQVSTTNDFSSNVGSNGSPITVGFSGTIPATTIYIRLAAGLSAGNYTGNIVLSSAGATNVNLATNAINTVNQKNVTISGLVADDKIFDNTTTTSLSGTASLSGVLAGDVSNVVLSGTPVANFLTAAVGTNKPVTVSGYSLTGSASSNYLLLQPSGLTASINSSGLQDQMITFGSLSSTTYGDNNFNLNATSNSGLTITYFSSNTNVATVLGNTVSIVGAGSTIISATQAGDSNYNAATSVDQLLVVNQKSLTVSGASASSKEYNGNNAATLSGGVLVGIFNSDNVTFSGNGVFDTPNVGTSKTVTGTLVLGGVKAVNYILTQPSLLADITPKELTITGISVSNKQYDTNNSASIVGTPTLLGLLTIDLTAVSLGGSPTATFGNSTVGTGKLVTISGYSISGLASGNYLLTQPSGITANITTKLLSIVGLTANNKIYNRDLATTLSGVATLSGIIPGDEAFVSLVGTPSAAFLSYTFGINKTVDVTGLSISGASIANYSLSNLSLTASILKKDVTVLSATATDKFYDGNTTATISGTLNGVVFPDAVTLNLSGVFADANVGTNKTVTSTSSITGVDVLNYNLIQPTGLLASINAAACGISSGLVTYNFNTSSPSSNTVNGVLVSPLTQGNNNGTSTLLSSTSASNFSGASAANNAGAAAFIGAINTLTSTYFEFSVTPQSGYNVSLTGLSFGSRSTGTGPKAYALKSNLDNYSANLATGVFNNNSTWVLFNPSTTTSSSNQAITYRLYGYDGAGGAVAGSVNWRIDDLKLNIIATPGAALTSATSAIICSGDTFSYSPITNYTGATISWARAAVTGISTTSVSTPQLTNPNEVLVNTTTTPIDVVYVYNVTTSTCFVSQNVTVTVRPIFNWYLDSDNDGYYFGSVITSCDSPGLGYKTSGIIASGDCDDTNPAINPGAVDVCYDGLDNNCDGIIDNGCTPVVSTLSTGSCGVTLSGWYSSVSVNNVAFAQGYR